MATDDEVTEAPPTLTTTDERPTERAARHAAPRVPTGRYHLGQVIGRGGMGEIVAARDNQLGREVAIKRLWRSDPTERQLTRFLHEARIQGRLDHPAIVPVHELGRDEAGIPPSRRRKQAS